MKCKINQGITQGITVPTKAIYQITLTKEVKFLSFIFKFVFPLNIHSSIINCLIKYYSYSANIECIYAIHRNQKVKLVFFLLFRNT